MSHASVTPKRHTQASNPSVQVLRWAKWAATSRSQLRQKHESLIYSELTCLSPVGGVGWAGDMLICGGGRLLSSYGSVGMVVWALLELLERRNQWQQQQSLSI